MRTARITSFTNPRVRHACRLRDSGYRRQQGQFLIDGLRETRRALEAGIELVEAFVRDDAPPEPAALLARIERGAALWRVPRALFEKLAFGDRQAGIVSLAREPRRALADLALPEAPLAAVLERLEKPGNVGAVLRSADAAGVSGVIVADAATDLFNPNAIRASQGAIFSLPLAVSSSGEAQAWLAERRLTTYVARVDAPRLYTEVDWRGPSALVLGSEHRGASSLWNPPAAEPIRLPMLGHGDSLNVSVAAAVIFYEARRQRGVPR